MVVFSCGVPLESVFMGIVGSGIDSGGFADGLWLDEVDNASGLASCLEVGGDVGGLVSRLAAVSVVLDLPYVGILNPERYKCQSP
ncbi:hypothetical protein M0R45_001913 [Rubus argutus]|uniref:Uncharacterized protein n=1 Tax=Rubus argutus TaxID=59490 RepID=A0AAW1VI20_RUBAR